MQPCNRIYYSNVYWSLYMFQAEYRSSSGALNCICSLWFTYTCGDRPLSRLSGKNSAFLISNFRRVLYVVCFLLGNSTASEFYMPTFRNTLSVPSCLWRWKRHSVPKRRHIKFRRRLITQRKTYKKINLDNGWSPHVYTNQRIQIQFRASDDERYAARNMLNLQ